MSSSSTPSKVNCLVIKTLHFRGVRGDLQERPYLFFPMPIPFFPSTKSPILCSKCLKSRVLKAWAPTVYAEELPTLLEMAAAWPGADAQTQNKNRKG